MNSDGYTLSIQHTGVVSCGDSEQEDSKAIAVSTLHKSLSIVCLLTVPCGLDNSVTSAYSVGWLDG
jgi:hypothetical protein